jgi:hypothetical protein
LRVRISSSVISGSPLRRKRAISRQITVILLN